MQIGRKKYIQDPYQKIFLKREDIWNMGTTQNSILGGTHFSEFWLRSPSTNADFFLKCFEQGTFRSFLRGY